MRKLKIMEHISLDGVIQISDGPHGDWTAVSHSCWVRESPCDVRRELRSIAWPSNLRSVVGILAEGTEESDGGAPEYGDEVCRNPQAGEPGMGAIQGRWTGPRG